MIRILLVDDHAIFRSGMRALLGSTPGLEIVAEANGGTEALATLDTDEVDLMLLDLNMPGGLSGARTAEKALEGRPDLAIVVLSMHDEPDYLRETLQIGARGYVLKRSPPEVLLGAIHAVAAGEQYIDPALIGGLIDVYVGRPEEAAGAHLDRLSEREREVCRLVALGFTNREVAVQLHISSRTVESHRSNIMGRLELSSRAELVRFAIDHGLIEVSGSA